MLVHTRHCSCHMPSWTSVKNVFFGNVLANIQSVHVKHPLAKFSTFENEFQFSLFSFSIWLENQCFRNVENGKVAMTENTAVLRALHHNGFYLETCSQPSNASLFTQTTFLVAFMGRNWIMITQCANPHPVALAQVHESS